MYDEDYPALDPMEVLALSGALADPDELEPEGVDEESTALLDGDF